METLLAATGQGVTWWLPVLAGILLAIGIAAFIFVRLSRRKNTVDSTPATTSAPPVDGGAGDPL